MIPMQQNKNEGVNAGQGVFRHSVAAARGADDSNMLASAHPAPGYQR